VECMDFRTYVFMTMLRYIFLQSRFFGSSQNVMTVDSVGDMVYSYTNHVFGNGGQKLPTGHTLDAMHCEKNVCENLLRTLFGETDGVKSREDMRARGIRKHLHLRRNADGQSYFKPDAPYVLSKQHQQEFLSTLRELKFPSNYVSALSRKIQDGKLRGLKTHDFHILLQQVIPLCLRNVGHPKVVGAIMRVSRLFRKICTKVVDAKKKCQCWKRLLKQFAV
jgi:hypothetical protein